MAHYCWTHWHEMFYSQSCSPENTTQNLWWPLLSCCQQVKVFTHPVKYLDIYLNDWHNFCTDIHSHQGMNHQQLWIVIVPCHCEHVSMHVSRLYNRTKPVAFILTESIDLLDILVMWRDSSTHLLPYYSSKLLFFCLCYLTVLVLWCVYWQADKESDDPVMKTG